jgi:hypothetical protein
MRDYTPVQGATAASQGAVRMAHASAARGITDDAPVILDSLKTVWCGSEAERRDPTCALGAHPETTSGRQAPTSS